MITKINDYLESLFEEPEIPIVDTGLERLDDLLNGGWHRGKLYCFSAASGVGKTTMMVSLAVHALKKGKKVLFAATEQTGKEIYAKMASNILGISQNEILRNANKYKEQLKNQCKPLLENCKFWYYESVNDKFNIGENDIDFFFYDYLGALSTGGEREWRELEMIASDLKQFAINHNCAVITSTQTSIDNVVNDDANKIKDERYIANSKGIARKLDFGAIIWTAGKGKPVNVDVYKNRNGKSRERFNVIYDYERNRVDEQA